MKKIYFLLFTFVSLSFFGQYPDWTYLSQTYGMESAAEYGNDIWVGGQTGLIQYNKLTGAKTYYDKTNSPLPENLITCLTIDGFGNKWMGTQVGLVKYNGSTWSVYTTTNSSLPYNDIRKIACDANNNIWIGTAFINGGLIKFNGSTWSVYTTTNSALPANYINDLCTQGTNVWVSGNGLTKFDGTNWTTFNTMNSNITATSSVLDMTADQAGNVWLMHTSDIEKCNGTNTFTTYNSSNTNINNNLLYCITTDTNNIVWVGCATSGSDLGGFKSFNGTNWTSYNSTNTTLNTDNIYPIFIDANNNPVGFSFEGFIHVKNGPSVTNTQLSKVALPNRFVKKVAFDKNGYPFIGTREDKSKLGLVKYDWFNLYPYSHFNDSSYNFCIDKNSNIFVKNRNTVYKNNGTSWSLLAGGPKYSIPVSASLPDMTLLEADTLGGVWVDYLAAITINTITSSPIFHEGVAYYNGSTWSVYCYTNSPMPDVGIYCLKTNKATNDIWIGTSNGLVKFDKTNWSVYTPTSAAIQKVVGSMDIDSLGNIWYGNGVGGFVKFDGVNFTNISSPISGGGLDINIDKSGTIWQIDYGMRLIGYDGSSWTLYNNTNSALPNFFNSFSLSVDKFNNKWLGTQIGAFIFKQGGVYSLNHDGKEKELSKAEIVIYPNPSSEKFNIKLDKNYRDVELTLFNSIGQEVLRINSDNTDLVEIKNNLAKGVYIYNIKAGATNWNGKIIAE